MASCAKCKAYQKSQQMLNFQPIDVDMGYDKPPPLIGPDTKYDPNKMRETIANWIMGTEQPFSVVENDLFVYMMKRANPLFQKTCRATIKEDCLKVYKHEMKKLKDLTSVASKISLTTDCWKSSHQKIEYIVITGHFIDQNWRYCRDFKRVLSFVHVPPPRIRLDIADGIYKCLKEWEIEGKIFYISVVMPHTMTGQVKKLPCGGRLFHVRCCAYILNLLVKDGLSNIDFVIKEVREAVKYINSSEARLHDRKLLLDVPTRWNSTYDMLSIALKFKDVFPRYAEYEPHFHHFPNEYEWKNMENVCEILKIFKVCTNVISGSDYL
uniref:hAT-like transposase RNase-H fold domain-containing protein n=1 Tax=Lactuca sativa TaxID=4236 RepID=A0A9R1WHT3_LACSA|nr:hypothetical protein LSAT_V11C200064300 [Lactuca sativa]